MATAWFKRIGDGLHPMDDEGHELLRSLSGPVIVSVTIPRNSALLRKFWAMISLVWENQERFPTKAALMEWIKGEIGVDSVSYAAMDEVEFRVVFARACDLIEQEIIPGIDQEDLRREVERMMT